MGICLVCGRRVGCLWTGGKRGPLGCLFFTGPRGQKVYEACNPDMPRLEGVLSDIVWNGVRVVQSEYEVREGIFPAYKPGSTVEFFSEKTCLWNLATVQVSYAGDFPTYAAHFGERLLPREDVALSHLRQPLHKNEVCSYYSRE